MSRTPFSARVKHSAAEFSTRALNEFNANRFRYHRRPMRFLQQLPPDVADKIATKNIDRLFP